MQELIIKIREEKKQNIRPLPSTTLIDSSNVLTREKRGMLLDEIALLVDENLTGRSNKCEPFADLLEKALNYLGIPAKFVFGSAIYFDKNGKQIWEWPHAWVRVGKEVVDGNIDLIKEDILFQSEAMTYPSLLEFKINPYWGIISDTPSDRRFFKGQKQDKYQDEDVDTYWWPDLKKWIDEDLL